MPRRRGVLALAVVAIAAGCGSSSDRITFDNTLAPRTTTTLAVLPVPRTVAPAPTSTNVPEETGDRSSATEAPPPMVEPPIASSFPPWPTATPGSMAPPSTASGSAPSFPYPSLYEVPQLGEDPVRGSGCGLADSLGNRMPDGIWYGLLYPGEGSGTVGFDVVCAYYGASALDEGAEPGLAEVFFPVNGSNRLRQIPLDEGFVWRVGTNVTGAGCVDPGPAADQPMSSLTAGADGWVIVEDDVAVLAVTLCD